MTDYTTAISPISKLHNITGEPGITNGFAVQRHEALAAPPRNYTDFNSLVVLSHPTHKTTVVLGAKGLDMLPPAIAQTLTEDQRRNFAGASFSDDAKAYAILVAVGSGTAIAKSEGGDRASTHSQVLQRYQYEVHRLRPAPSAAPAPRF